MHSLDTQTRELIGDNKPQMDLVSEGIVELDNWGSCFWHPELKVSLIVYVDDFKLAGPTRNLTEGRGLSRKGSKLTIPTQWVSF